MTTAALLVVLASCSDSPAVPASSARLLTTGVPRVGEPDDGFPAGLRRSEEEELAAGIALYAALRSGRPAESLDEYLVGGWAVAYEGDVNHDNVDDAFIWNLHQCGSGGCDIWLIQSGPLGFTPVFNAFADECWDAREFIVWRSSIDCLVRAYPFGAPVEVVVRYRWTPPVPGATGADAEWRYTGGLAALAHEKSARCPRPTVLRDTRLYPLPRSRLRFVQVPRTDEISMDPVHELTDQIWGPLGVVWFLTDEQGTDGDWSWAGWGREMPPPDDVFSDEIVAGATFASSVEAEEDNGTRWLSHELEGTKWGWVRAEDTDCRD